jgi:hypothetical protein
VESLEEIRELRRTVELLQENIRFRKLLSEKQAAQGIEVRFVDAPVETDREFLALCGIAFK